MTRTKKLGGRKVTDVNAAKERKYVEIVKMTQILAWIDKKRAVKLIYNSSYSWWWSSRLVPLTGSRRKKKIRERRRAGLRGSLGRVRWRVSR